MARARVEPAAAPRSGAGFVVRDATAADLGSVVELRLSLLQEYDGHAVYGRLHPEADARALELCAQQLASPRDLFVLAEADGAAIGLLRCSEAKASPLLLPDRFAYVSSVYVRPSFRRRGVLRALLARAEAWCAEHGLDEMRLHNVPGEGAAGAWQALGFEAVEEVRTRILRGA